MLSFCIIILCGCSAPSYLPHYSRIDINQFGGYISINRKTGSDLNGELIAINSTSIVVKIEGRFKCETISVNDIKDWNLRYAKPVNYGLSIPAGIILPFIHGRFMLYTMPAHFLISTGVTVAGAKDFIYNKENMTLEQLKMFARFPQGIPKHININTIQ